MSYRAMVLTLSALAGLTPLSVRAQAPVIMVAPPALVSGLSYVNPSTGEIIPVPPHAESGTATMPRHPRLRPGLKYVNLFEGTEVNVPRRSLGILPPAPTPQVPLHAGLKYVNFFSGTEVNVPRHGWEVPVPRVLPHAAPQAGSGRVVSPFHR